MQLATNNKLKNKTMKKILFTIITLLTSFIFFLYFVDEIKAKEVALNFLINKTNLKNNSIAKKDLYIFTTSK